MADRYEAADDAAVDELKRRARRRLVGAVVLALAAAIVVPMLLEREPRPLGDGVSVQIPPVDEGKFVNRLSDPKSGATSKAPKSDAAATKSISDAEQRVLAPPAQPPAPAPVATTPETKAAPATEPTAASSEKMQSTASTSEAPKPPAPERAPVATASPAAPSVAAADEGYVVQLAAFADDKGANALAGKLKKAGYPAYTEPVHTSRGTLWRVRVGSYPSRDAASDARNKLKVDGYSGIVAAAK